MRRLLQIIAGMSIAAAAVGCGDTVNYNPATTTDTTPPTVNLLIKRGGQPDLEVQGRVVPSPNTKGDIGNPIPTQKFDFSVLATAKDAESGIRNIKLSMTRTVCYMATGGVLAQAYFGSVVRKEANYTDPTKAPTQPSVGDTGIIDNSASGTNPANLTDDNLLVWKNANQQRNVGVGVSTKWFLEATNFAGTTVYSDVIFILAGDTSCVTQP
jgi:hypothetical protein